MAHPLVSAHPYPILLDSATSVTQDIRARPNCANYWTSHMQGEETPIGDDLVEDLDTEVPAFRTIGGPARPIHIEYSRDLTAADVVALNVPRGTRPKSLLRIHASHHSLARCLATGMKPGQASLVTGYAPARISTLQNDPAFTALVADYRAEAKSVFADLAERMSNVSLDALELLHERLQDNPETFTIPVLIDVVKTFADRTGHGPGQEVHLKVDRDFIDRPPRENFEEWKERRTRELEGPSEETPIGNDKLN